MTKKWTMNLLLPDFRELSTGTNFFTSFCSASKNAMKEFSGNAKCHGKKILTKVFFPVEMQ